MLKFTEWWVSFRDKAEAFFGHAVQVAAPIAMQALETAGAAVVKAGTDGTAKDAHGLAMVAVNSLKDQAPALGAKMTLAIAADAVHLHGPVDQVETPPIMDSQK
jgi:hypothetical protein